MAKEVDRKDALPWEKIHAVKEVMDLIGEGKSLSTSLRMSRFSPVGGRVKKPAVDWMCKGVQQACEIPFPATGSFEMKLKSRMMVNHSGGVMENATLALHPHFGTPVIPGSALKGVAGHAAWCEWLETEEDDRNLIGSIIAEVFGFPVGNRDLDAALESSTDTRSGAIAFLSAQVKGTAKLEADLINSHERGSPIPVFFPAVASGTVFEFCLMPLRLKTETDMENLMMFAEGWLKSGLKDHGAGAKTNAGYGWFEEVE